MNFVEYKGVWYTGRPQSTESTGGVGWWGNLFFFFSFFFGGGGGTSSFSIQRSHIILITQFNTITKNFNHPTRGNFVVVMAGS